MKVIGAALAGAALVVAVAVSSLQGAAVSGGQDAYAVTMAAARAGALTPGQSCAGPITGQAAAAPGAAAGVGDDAVLVTARAAYNAGWRGPDLVTAVAVVGAESTYRADAYNPAAGGNWGLWQINSVHAGLLASGDWRDPAANARMGYQVWKDAGGSWRPWEAYTTARHEKYRGQAQAAVDQLQVDTTAEGALADGGGDPCVPDDAGRSGAEGDGATSCAGGGGRAAVTPAGTQITVCSIGSLTIDSRFASQVQRMVNDAAAAGLRLSGSGYRDTARQTELRAQNCNQNGCHPPTAPAGVSRHEFGQALDLTCEGSLIRSRTSPCYVFLASTGGGVGTAKGTVNAYGFRNLTSEPWHWSTGDKPGN